MQRVKIGNSKSDWKILNKGVPQGSILGPLLFNVYTNDLFLEFGEKCNLYNFADDNTIGSWNFDPISVKKELELNSCIALEWFYENGMSANASKFHSLFLKFGNRGDEIELNINGIELKPSMQVKLLGVTFDEKLNFNAHVDLICKKKLPDKSMLFLE